MKNQENVRSRFCLANYKHPYQIGRILGWFWDRFLMFFVKRGAWLGDAKIIVLYWFLQCFVAIDLWNKFKTHAVRMEGVLGEGCRHHFFIDFDSILTSILAHFLFDFGHFWQWILKQISDIDFWRDFDEKWTKKFQMRQGWRQRRGLLSCQRQPKTQWFDTPSTCRRQGRRILSASRHPAALCKNCKLKCKRASKSDFDTFLATFLVALGLILEVSGLHFGTLKCFRITFETQKAPRRFLGRFPKVRSSKN